MATGPVPYRTVASNGLVGVVLVSISAGLSWLWTSTTTTAHECETGAGRSALGIVVFVVLVLLAPTGVAWHGWRARLPLSYIVSLAVVAICVGVAGVYLGDAVWWSAHDCMT
jgi:hypothetical protein